MSPQAEKLLEEVLRLPLQDREFIVTHLSESMDEEFEYSPELAAEIRRREAELDSGAEQPVPHEEAMRLMFEKRDV
jgi:putative addiction module component (TIGR02574 family)